MINNAEHFCRQLFPGILIQRPVNGMIIGDVCGRENLCAFKAVKFQPAIVPGLIRVGGVGVDLSWTDEKAGTGRQMAGVGFSAAAHSHLLSDLSEADHRRRGLRSSEIISGGCLAVPISAFSKIGINAVSFYF